MPFQLGAGAQWHPIHRTREQRQVLPTAQSRPDGQMDEWKAPSPGQLQVWEPGSAGVALWMTSEHLGAAGTWRSWGPAALCQWVAADDQLQHIARLGQERHRQAAVEVPRAHVVDLCGAQPRGQTGVSLQAG